MSSIEPLKTGDEIRVVAPSQSARKHGYARAAQRLEGLGYKITFGKYVNERLHLNTASAAERAEDFNNAFRDKKVKAVLALNGGWSANEILPLIDWAVVRANPKPLIGYSDITVLLNALYGKTGQVSFLGPNFGTLGRSTLWQYSFDNLVALLRGELPRELGPSHYWSAHSLKKRRRAQPWTVIQAGSGQGTVIGGNLGTLYLLQGTEYQPRFDQPYILAAEDDSQSGKYTAHEFSRRLESILQLPGARQNLQGMIIGRFEPDSRVTQPILKSIIESKQLKHLPIVANVDFGHTYPMLTLPIGGRLRIDTGKKTCLELLK